VRIAHRHLDRLVAHQLRHRPQINPGHRQPTRKGVPETIPSEICNPGVLHSWLEPVLVAI
jgi:hypothetical protein